MQNKILQQKLNRAKRLADSPFKDLKGVTYNNPPLTVEFGMLKAKRLALKGIEVAQWESPFIGRIIYQRGIGYLFYCLLVSLLVL